MYSEHFWETLNTCPPQSPSEGLTTYGALCIRGCDLVQALCTLCWGLCWMWPANPVRALLEKLDSGIYWESHQKGRTPEAERYPKTRHQAEAVKLEDSKRLVSGTAEAGQTCCHHSDETDQGTISPEWPGTRPVSTANELVSSLPAFPYVLSIS